MDEEAYPGTTAENGVPYIVLDDEQSPDEPTEFSSSVSPTAVRPLAQVSPAPKPARFIVTTLFVATEIIVLFAMFAVRNFRVEPIAKNFFIGPADDTALLLEWGAKYGPIMRQGDSMAMFLESRRLFVAALLHVGILHLFMNISIQLTIGRKVEIVHGSWRTLVVCIVSAIGGNISSCVFAPNLLEAGASSIGFGLFGLIAADWGKNKRRLKNPRRVIIILIVTLVLCFAIGLLPWIDNFAHLGGFVSGWLVGIVILPSGSTLQSSSTLQKTRVTSPINDDNGSPLVTMPPPSPMKRKELPLGILLLKTRIWTRFRRTIAVGLLVSLFVLGLIVFYVWEDPVEDSCAFCRWISCLPVFDVCKT